MNSKPLLDFIIQQELPDVSTYHELVPLISERFSISKRDSLGTDAVMECVNDVISWENGNKYCSLEKLLNDNYKIVPLVS